MTKAATNDAPLRLRTLAAYGLPSLPSTILTFPLFVLLPTFYAQDLAGRRPSWCWRFSTRLRRSSIACDVTYPAAVHAAHRKAADTLGRIDLCVACAGTHTPMGATSFDAVKFRKLVGVNLMGTVHILEAAIPDMIARKRGHLAVVSSVAGYRELPSAAGYGATKAALINMCEALKFDLDRAGV